MPEDTQRILQELKHNTHLKDVPENELLWLAERLTEHTFAAGEIMAKEGGAAVTFDILLEGQFQLRRESDSVDARVFVSRGGDIVGKLPYSRLTIWPGTFRALTPARILRGSTD